MSRPAPAPAVCAQCVGYEGRVGELGAEIRALHALVDRLQQVVLWCLVFFNLEMDVA